MGDPYLRLSDQFLVDNQSNRKLICEYLNSQWQNCGFNENINSWLYIKYKRVYINHAKF